MIGDVYLVRTEGPPALHGYHRGEAVEQTSGWEPHLSVFTACFRAQDAGEHYGPGFLQELSHTDVMKYPTALFPKTEEE